MNTKKNYTLELLKLFASYMVVFIHVPFCGNTGIVMDALARFAVPFFFLVSGFYSYQITCKQIKKRVRNILTLLILAVVCCNAFEIVTLLKYNTEGLVAFLNKYTDLRVYIKLFIFNLPVNFGHIWYLFAVLYVYVAFYFCTKFGIKDNVIFIISLMLLILHIILGEGLAVFDIVLPIYMVRNFAVMGIPFFAMGLFLKKYEYKLRSIPDYLIFIFIITGAFESIISRYLFGENELYIGSLFILFGVTSTFIKYSFVKYPVFFKSLGGCSTYIYIFHIAISSVVYMIYYVFGIDIYHSVILEQLHPLIVCIFSTVFAYFFKKILQRLTNNAKAR